MPGSPTAVALPMAAAALLPMPAQPAQQPQQPQPQPLLPSAAAEAPRTVQMAYSGNALCAVTLTRSAAAAAAAADAAGACPALPPLLNTTQRTSLSQAATFFDECVALRSALHVFHLAPAPGSSADELERWRDFVQKLTHKSRAGVIKGGLVGATAFVLPPGAALGALGGDAAGVRLVVVRK
jgi:hypothetical protein